jgi:hypothetical protein
MSSITGLISGGSGAAVPVNGIAKFYKNPNVLSFTDELGQVWLRRGTQFKNNLGNYPDADVYNDARSYSLIGSKTINTGTTSNDDLDTDNMYVRPNGSSIYFSDDGDRIVVYSMSNYDTDTLTFAYRTAQGAWPDSYSNMFWSSNGTRVYGHQYGSSLKQRNVSTAWNANTVSLNDTKTRSMANSYYSFKISYNGLYIYRASGTVIYSHPFGTAWEIDTINETVTKSFNAQAAMPFQLQQALAGISYYGISENGTELIIYSGGQSNTEFAGLMKYIVFSLSTAYDISTATYSYIAEAPGINPANLSNNSFVGANNEYHLGFRPMGFSEGYLYGVSSYSRTNTIGIQEYGDFNDFLRIK